RRPSSASTWLLLRTYVPALSLTTAPKVPAITIWLGGGNLNPMELPGCAGRNRDLGLGMGANARNSPASSTSTGKPSTLFGSNSDFDNSLSVYFLRTKNFTDNSPVG